MKLKNTYENVAFWCLEKKDTTLLAVKFSFILIEYDTSTLADKFLLEFG